MNPTIEQLKQADKYDLIAEPRHAHIKEFILTQAQKNSMVIRIYMIYQLVMVLIGIFFLARAVVLVLKNLYGPLFFTALAVIISFSVLIVVHEFLHGLALKIEGAPRVSYGGNIKKFIFYAEADQFVMGRKQFEFVALAPFILIKTISLTGIFLFFNVPAVYFFIILMCLHSLFCAGDMALLAFFYEYKSSEVYTYDSKEEGKSYFYKAKDL